jgi:hypothetical protein
MKKTFYSIKEKNTEKYGYISIQVSDCDDCGQHEFYNLRL